MANRRRNIDTPDLQVQNNAANQNNPLPRRRRGIPAAQQIEAPGAPEQSNNINNKSKKKKSGGFLSKIFGSKPKDNQAQNQTNPPEQTNNPMATQQQPVPRARRGRGNAGGQVMNQPQMNQPQMMNQPQQNIRQQMADQGFQAQPQPQPATQVLSQQPLMSNNEASGIYSGQSLEQIIFGYIEPSRQGGLLDVVKSFENIRIIMAPDVNSLTDFYRRNNIAGNILLFVFNPNEVEPVARFLKELNLATINPSLMTVMVVRDKDLDITPILQVPNIGQFCRVAKLDKLMFTVQMCNKIIAQVVKKQPVYPELTKVSVPENASLAIDNKTFKVDFDRVKESLARARKGSADVELAETIKKKILSMTSANDSLSVIQDNLPQLKLLKDLEAELNREIDKIKYKDGFKDELAQMLTDKILLSTLSTKELKSYLKDIIDRATEEKMVVQNTLTSITPEDVERINSMHEDTSLMMQKRNELEKQVTDSYNEYLIKSQLVINTLKLEERRCVAVNNEMCELLRENVIPDNLQNGVSTYMSRVKAMRAEISSLSQKTTQELSEVFQMANTLLKDQSTLIKIDNVLLAALQQEVELLSKTQNTVMVYNTGLKARGSIIYRVSGGHMRTMFDLTTDESDFIISIRNNPNEEHLNIGDEILTSKEFLERVPEEFGNLEKKIELQLEDNEDSLDLIVSTVDYIAKYFRRIYIVIALNETLSSTEIHMTEEAFRNAIAKVSFWTIPDHSKMLLINSVITKLMVAYKDIMLPTIVFNDTPKGTPPETFDRLIIDANLPSKTHVYSIPHLRTLESGLMPNPETIAKLKGVIENI